MAPSQDAPPQWMRDPRFWYVLVATLFSLSFAWSVKAPCVTEPWTDDSQYAQLCYNDIQPLYFHRSMNEDVVPYVGAPGNNSDGSPKGFVEYPTLTGLTMYVAALLTDDEQPGAGNTYFVWNALILSLFALGTTVALYFAVDDKRKVLFWAAGPPLALYAFHNWDLLAVFFGSLGLTLFLRGRFLGSGAALAAGASAKLFPLFLAPFLGLWLLRRDRGLRADGWRFGLGFLGALTLINGPFLLLNPSLFLRTYTFHIERVPNFETIWYVMAYYGREWKLDWMTEASAKATLDALGPIAILALAGVLGWRVLVGRLDPVAAALGGMLIFLLINKIFSVQYAMWVLPVFVLLRMPLWTFAGFVAADTAVYVTVFTFFLKGWHWFDDLARSVVARTLMIAILLGHVVWMGFRTPRPQRPSATSDGTTPDAKGRTSPPSRGSPPRGSPTPAAPPQGRTRRPRPDPSHPPARPR